MLHLLADIDECTSKETCLADQTCINTDGSFICINSPCNAGYKRVNGSCKGMLKFEAVGFLCCTICTWCPKKGFHLVSLVSVLLQRGEWPSGLYSPRQVTEVKLGRVRSNSLTSSRRPSEGTLN